MFWRVSTFSQPSAIEAILDRPNCKLEDLLPEEQLVQELKAQNARAIEFLAKPENVQGLVRHLVVPPTPDTDQGQAQRLPQAACEVLCCEVDPILTALLQNEATMEILFSLLQQTPPLECTAAGYFARVVGMLLFRRTVEVMTFLQERWHLLTRLVVHLDTASICEILVRLTGAEEHTGMYLPPSKVKWLLDTSLVTDLLAVLGPDQPSDAARHAADVLVSVARSTLSPLQAAMGEPPFLATLLGRAFDVDSTSSVQALDVCIALLDPRGGEPLSPAVSTGSVFASSPPGVGHMGGPPVQGGSGDFRRSGSVCLASLQSRAVSGMVPYVDRLTEMLLDSSAPSKHQTSYGVLEPPLGTGRLKAVEVVAALARVGVPAAEGALAAGGLIQQCLALFLQYPFNNMLHHQVTMMVMGVLDRADPSLVEHLFREAHLPTWLAEAPAEVAPRLREFGTLSSATRRPLRAGYMGHVTYIANKVIEAAPRLGLVDELGANICWRAFCEGPLKERNDLENVDKWECGRPAMERPGAEDGAGDDASLMDLEAKPGGSKLDGTDDTVSAVDDHMDGWANEPSGSDSVSYFNDGVGHSADHYGDADGPDPIRQPPYLDQFNTESAPDASDPSNESSSNGCSVEINRGSSPQGSLFTAGYGALSLGRQHDWTPKVRQDRPVSWERTLTANDPELAHEFVGEDAVVIGLPEVELSSRLPPTQPAVVPHLEHETPVGLDASKASSAAVPPQLPPFLAHSGAAHSGAVDKDLPQQSLPLPSHDGSAPVESQGSRGSSSSTQGRARSSIASTAAWLRAAGSKVTLSPKSGSGEALASLSATNRLPPRSAFASWRPAWQAVEDRAAAAAASAAADFVARSATTAAAPCCSSDSLSGNGVMVTRHHSLEPPLDAGEVAAKAKLFGTNRANSSNYTSRPIGRTMSDNLSGRSDSLPDKLTNRPDLVWYELPDESVPVSDTSDTAANCDGQQSVNNHSTSAGRYGKLFDSGGGSWVLSDRRPVSSDGRPKFNFSDIKSAVQKHEACDLDD